VGSVVVIGGTSGLGLEVARHYAAAGRDVVITGRDQERTAALAAQVGPTVRGLGVDLAEPKGIAGALADVGPVDHLVLSAIARDQNKATDYNIDGALYLVTLKLVGYTEVVHALCGCCRRRGRSCSSAGRPRSGRTRDRPP
jgi:short-subunit dehydrogenase